MAGKTEHTHPAAAGEASPAAAPHDHSADRHGHAQDGTTDNAHRVKDPVCGMMVDPHTTQHKAEHAGRPYYFCSAGCRAKFLAEPERYLDPAAAAAKA